MSSFIRVGVGGEPSGQGGRCDPDQIIGDVISQFRPALERRGVEVAWQAGEAGEMILDGDALAQIVWNLISNEEVDVVVGLELGGDDFIRKPFTPGEVLARIWAALRRAYPEEGRRVVTMGTLKVWPEELRAEREGRAIELTPRELKILLLLAEKKNRPVSRDEFLDRCWGMDYFPDSRTLDQHVHILRKKIGNEPELIETVRGVGYRFRG